MTYTSCRTSSVSLDIVCGCTRTHYRLPVAVMREALRLSPTAPVRTCAPIDATTVKNGAYALEKDVSVVVNVTMAHRDPKVWGADVSPRFCVGTYCRG